MKKNILTTLILLFSFQLIFSQEKLTENQKLTSLCKFWGFLKYYHPNVAKGTINWDKELIEKIKELKEVNTKNELNKTYLNWLNKLGDFPKCETCELKTDIEYFDKNFDLNWTDNKSTFSEELIEKLNYIEQNRNQGINHYVKLDENFKIQIQNEQEYSISFPEKEYRLLELFKYWNIIEYFFPYKYQTDQNWNDVLEEMIPKFFNSTDITTYHLSILELVTKIDDSHAKFKSSEILKNFGVLKIPIQCELLENKLIIARILNQDIAEKENIKVGDIIEEINGKTIEEIITELSKYIPASNKSVKIRNLIRDNYFIRGTKNSLQLKINRDGNIFEKQINLYSFNEINYDYKKNINSESKKWEILEGNIGFVNIGLLTKEDVETMFAEFKDTKAIIFDYRHYPKRTGHKINDFIASKPTVFWSKISQDLSYPGKFIWKRNLKSGKFNEANYKEKILILVNENSQSQSEFATMILQSNPNVKTIGSQTSGADGDICKIKIAGIETVFSGLGVFYPDDTETQRKGVKIDIEVKPTINGLKENKDEVLERAIEYINSGK